MNRAVLFALSIVAGAIQLQSANADPAPRVHGVVTAYDGQYLTLKADSGSTVVLGVPFSMRILHSQRMALTDVKEGDQIGVIAMNGKDDKLRALAIRVFANSVEVGEGGRYALASNPDRIMINGAVSAVSVTPAGGALSMTFHGAAPDETGACTGRALASGWGCTGSAELIVARGVPIIVLSKGNTLMLQPGAIVSAITSADGTSPILADSITIERDAN